MSKTLVMKFGGAAVATIDHFPAIAEIIISRLQHYSRLIVVVSAMGKTTDELIALAHQVHPHPPQREYDMLISVGERISMSLLAMALLHKRHEAMSFTGSQSGIITSNHHANAQIIDVRPHRLDACLEQSKIAIVAGFQGVSLDKEITTLGRGGSDTTAVALATAYGASVEFYKDVPGVFDSDPKQVMDAFQHPHLTYQAAMDIVSKGAKILHSRAIALAQANAIQLHVKSFKQEHQRHSGTLIYDPGCTPPASPIYEGVVK